MVIETCAKVNLTLEMLRRRDDGYHDLATVFQAVDLCDRITLSAAPRLTITVSGADVPCDERNLCHRAATALAARYGVDPAVAIRLSKAIPVGAGLGGGSGNAAGVLAALAEWWQLPASPDELHARAADLGSDVAFFLDGGAAVGSGRGECLEAVPSLPDRTILVLEPAEPVSTGAVYRALAGFRPEAGQATEALAAGLRAGQVPPTEAWLVNDLEAPAAEVSVGVRGDRVRLSELGLPCYRLSGSGGAWFLPLLPDEVEPARRALEQAWPGRCVWVTQPVPYGWRRVD